jgi:hypothetical protein
MQRGLNGTGRKVPHSFTVLEIADALTRVYPTDAHLVTYVLSGATKQPRINKDGLRDAPAIPQVEVFFCDSDNPGHAAWTPEALELSVKEEAALRPLETAGVYYTAHGRRIVQPIAEPIPVTRVEPYLRRWLHELQSAGVRVDWQCAGWPRLFRLPHVLRDERPYRSPRVALDRMRAIPLAPMPPAPEWAQAASAPRGRRGRSGLVQRVDWVREAPAAWVERVEKIARAVRAVDSEWHTLFLAIAGALVQRNVPHEVVPALCRAISLATGADTRSADREISARTTVKRWLAEQSVRGRGELERNWPGVADAVDDAVATGAHARARAQAKAAPAAPPPTALADTTKRLEAAIRNAPDGVTLISAECGLGKTQAAMRVAVERAAKEHASATADTTRAPLQSKTVISVDKNALAVQIQRNLEHAGTPVKRVFGPLSVVREDGTPECRYAQNAKPLVEGGQSMHVSFCRRGRDERCEYWDECKARDGAEGPDDARVIIGPHAMISRLSGEAGKTGLLVIDEPPALIENVTVSLADLDACVRMLPMFSSRYAAAMLPAIRAVRAWADIFAEPEKPAKPADVLTAALPYVVDAELDAARRAVGVAASDDRARDIVACAAAALDKEKHEVAPPIRPAELHAARRSVDLAVRLGSASRILRALQFALTTEERVAFRVEVKVVDRVLVITHTRADYAEALRREGATVLMDASADLHVEPVRSVVGYEPRIERFLASDGASIERTRIHCSMLSRTQLLDGGKLGSFSRVARAVSVAIDWALEDPHAQRVGLITFRAVALALRLARSPDDARARAAWLDAGHAPESVDAVARELGPVMRRWPGELRFGHYGAMRGLDHMKDVDAIVTIGDPKQNLDDVKHTVDFLGLTQGWSDRVNALCRAELEQAHGRLRAVHRTRAGRALHIGEELPGGSGWRDGAVQHRVMPGGRPATLVQIPRAELRAHVDRLGGIRATAAALRCGKSSVLEWLQGKRGVPEPLAKKLRASAGVAA